MSSAETETLVLLYEDGLVVNAVVVVGEVEGYGTQIASVVRTARRWAEETAQHVDWAAPVRDAKTIDHPDLDRVPIEAVT